MAAGRKKRQLLQLLERRGLGACARHLPWLERAELLTLYREASVFFFPSHEGAGMVVAEAMSYGVPVLCYRNEGPGELVPPASQLKVPYAPFQQNIRRFRGPADGPVCAPRLAGRRSRSCAAFT